MDGYIMEKNLKFTWIFELKYTLFVCLFGASSLACVPNLPLQYVPLEGQKAWEELIQGGL